MIEVKGEPRKDVQPDMRVDSFKKKVDLPSFRPGYKVWLERGGVVFGDGLFDLLRLIDECGSISRAAEGMQMSYRAAWGKIKRAEKAWGISLVYSRAGGEMGGGTSLTPHGRELCRIYRQLREEMKDTIRGFSFSLSKE